MGCDIHTIVEIKRNGKWRYIPELPKAYDIRYYDLFSLLNRNIRNYNCRNGFEEKGVPEDVSGHLFRFYSQNEDLMKAYERSTLVCWIEETQSHISPYDESLQIEINEELYEQLTENPTEEQKLRYHMPHKAGYPEKFFVQDAQKVNGCFVQKPFKEIYKSLDAFNNEFYKYTWHEKEKSYGYYEVDFTDKGYMHSHSYLTLAELKTKSTKTTPINSFEVPKELVEQLDSALYEWPESIVIERVNDTTCNMVFTEDAEEHIVYNTYNQGIIELEEIKAKYDIEDDEDIRIVFGFDS